MTDEEHETLTTAVKGLKLVSIEDGVIAFYHPSRSTYDISLKRIQNATDVLQWADHMAQRVG